LLEVLGGNLRQRVARVLIEEAQDGTLRLPQRRIARMLGVQRTSVNKILKSLEEDGLVTLSYGRVRLDDRIQLDAIAFSGDNALHSCFPPRTRSYEPNARSGHG
jgi:biotin operon repressor